MKKIIIMGAGVVGITTAYFLQQKGYDVTVVDAEDGAGKGTSYANGAQLSYSKTYPLSSPTTLKNLPGYLFSKNSPVHFRWKILFDWQFIKFSWHFLKNSTAKKAMENNDKVITLAMESRAAIREVLEKEKLDFDLEQSGKFYIYRSEGEAQKAREYIEHQNKFGLNWRMIDIEEAIKMEPAFEDMKDEIVAVSFCEVDESGDAYKFTKQVAEICQERGAKLLWNTKIEGFETENGQIKSIIANGEKLEADEFVCCLGPQAPLLLKKLGVYVPIYPMKGYSITVPAGNKAPVISITDESKRLVFTKIGQRLRVVGIAEFDGYSKNIDRKIMDGLVEDSKEVMPSGGDFSQVEEWVGLRPMTASTVPIIEQNKKFKNLYLNCGQGMLGWTLGCGSAKRLAELV